MRRTISTLLIAAIFLVGLPRLGAAQTATPARDQVPTVPTPPGLVAQPGPAPVPYPGPAPAPYPAPYPAPAPYYAPPPYSVPELYLPPAPVPPVYVEGEKPPAGYHVEKRSRKGLIIAGSIVTGVLYTLSLVSAAAQDTDHSPSGWLYVPIVGPWIALGKLGSYDEAACDAQSTGDQVCPSKSGARTGYALLGLGQLIGVLLITSGIVFPSTQLVPDAITNNGISVLPFYAGNSGGLAVVGRF